MHIDILQMMHATANCVFLSTMSLSEHDPEAAPNAIDVIENDLKTIKRTD